MKKLLALVTCSYLPFILVADDATAPQKSSQIFSNLSDSDKTALGLDKLTPDQMNKLENWVENHKSKKSNKVPRASVDLTLTSTAESGKFLTLSNGMQVEVMGSGRKKSPSFKVNDKLHVEEGYKKGWVKITNSTSGVHVRAKILSGDMKTPVEVKPVEKPTAEKPAS